MKQKIKLAVDIDGVLAENIGPYRSRKPILENIMVVNKLYDFCRIVLHTSRFNSDRRITIKWLRQNNVKYHRLVMGKFRASYYIDDRSIGLKDFYENYLIT